MQRKDGPKQQRRKRKDPQSRDFRCKCGKSYLSYAAVYTHVKNKHQGNKQFEDSIIKPQKQKLKRGRPKDKKQIVISSQTQTLSICEETTLLLYEKLKQKKDLFNHGIILQGNEEMDQSAFARQYAKLLERKKVELNLLDEDCKDQEEEDQARIFQKFISGVIKHFKAEIAARVAYAVNFYSQLYSELNFQDQNQMEGYFRELDSMSLWNGQNQANRIIYQAMTKWQNLVRKDQQVDE